MSTNPYHPPDGPDGLDETELPGNKMQLESVHFGPALFGAAVRIVGLMLCLYSLNWFYWGFFVAAGVIRSPEAPVFDYAASGAAYLLGGLLLLRGAPVVVRFSYSRNADT